MLIPSWGAYLKKVILSSARPSHTKKNVEFKIPEKQNFVRSLRNTQKPREIRIVQSVETFMITESLFLSESLETLFSFICFFSSLSLIRFLICFTNKLPIYRSALCCRTLLRYSKLARFCAFLFATDAQSSFRFYFSADSFKKYSFFMYTSGARRKGKKWRWNWNWLLYYALFDS